MVEAHHEIVELDLNPVLARPDGALAVDARIRVETPPQRRSWPSTRKLGDP
ncbi:MAG: acetate--CoA ligase family protein [Solirubrobacterales bacterium]